MFAGNSPYRKNGSVRFISSVDERLSITHIAGIRSIDYPGVRVPLRLHMPDLSWHSRKPGEYSTNTAEKRRNMTITDLN